MRLVKETFVGKGHGLFFNPKRIAVFPRTTLSYLGSLKTLNDRERMPCRKLFQSSLCVNYVVSPCYTLTVLLRSSVVSYSSLSHVEK